MTKRYGSFAHNDMQLFETLLEEFKKNVIVNTKTISFCDTYILPELVEAAEAGLNEIHMDLSSYQEILKKEVFTNEIIELLRIRGFYAKNVFDTIQVSFINQP